MPKGEAKAKVPHQCLTAERLEAKRNGVIDDAVDATRTLIHIMIDTSAKFEVMLKTTPSGDLNEDVQQLAVVMDKINQMKMKAKAIFEYCDEALYLQDLVNDTTDE